MVEEEVEKTLRMNGPKHGKALEGRGTREEKAYEGGEM